MASSSLADRDNKIADLLKVLEDRKQFLSDRYKTLQRSSKKDNKYLEDIAIEYENTVNKNKKLKQDQINALKNISDYISVTSIMNELSPELLKHSKDQQKYINFKISSINKELAN